MITLETPTIARLGGYEAMRPALEKALTYVDKGVDFELGKTTRSLRRFRSSGFRGSYLSKHSQEEYEGLIASLEEKQARLKVERKKCLLLEDVGGPFVYSGLATRIAKAAGDKVNLAYELPDEKGLPYEVEPRYQDRPYQSEAQVALLENCPKGPCGIELPTGAGKSTVIRNLIKSLGLRTVVMAPSTSIAGQLFDDLTVAFGKRHVGMFGDGKKQFDRHIVVGIDDSLSRVGYDTEAWGCLSNRPVFIADESHLTPAASLSRVCFGLMAGAPYRFFVSATQMRNDGADLLLEGITGPIVYRRTFRELVDWGYLARPTFKMVCVTSPSKVKTDDANRMTREHLYYNPRVVKVAADLANKFVSLMRRPTLILVEELAQFRELLPHFKHQAKFAHGPLSKDTKELVPAQYHDDKPRDLVEQFNRGELPILVGTSCIATGTDIRVAEAGIYLMGQTSTIKLSQAFGRFTRGGAEGTVVNPWTGKQKTDVVFVDFRVVDVDAMERHADVRERVYSDLYAAPDEINMTGVI